MWLFLLLHSALGHETLEAKSFLHQFPQCRSRSSVRGRLQPVFEFLNAKRGRGICPNPEAPLFLEKDIGSSGDLNTVIPEWQYPQVKTGHKLYFAHKKTGKTEEINPIPTHTGTITGVSGDDVTVTWDVSPGEAPGTTFNFKTTKGLAVQAKSKPWTVGFGAFDHFESVFLRDVKAANLNWATDRIAYFHDQQLAVDGETKSKADFAAAIAAVTQQATEEEEKIADAVKKWGKSQAGQKWLRAIFKAVSGDICDASDDFTCHFGHQRGPLAKSSSQAYSAGVHSDMADLENWRFSLATPFHGDDNAPYGGRWNFPDTNPHRDTLTLRNALESYAWTNLWLALEKYHDYPLAMTDWKSGSNCAGRDTNGVLPGYCRLDWYAARDWTLGEVMVFDGHVSSIHEAMVLPKKTESDLEARTSVEFRCRCKCKSSGCGFSHWDDHFPFRSGSVTPAFTDEAVQVVVNEQEQVELNAEEKSEDD